MVAGPTRSDAMTSSARRISKGWAVTAAVLGALVLGVVACEVAGWPFLAKPVERFLSRTLAT
jgi:Na+/H+-translocating membrane pyrophosphatase